MSEQSWEKEAERYSQNADYWRDRAEKAEADLARRDEIIARLKEDAERLYKIDDYCCCVEHENYVTCVFSADEHSPTCVKHLHRALMKELE